MMKLTSKLKALTCVSAAFFAMTAVEAFAQRTFDPDGYVICARRANGIQLTARPAANGCKSNEFFLRLPAPFFGNGSAGPLEITEDKTLNQADYANLQFTDCSIASGVTLSVYSGTVIRCAGTFTNDGTITVFTGTDGGYIFGTGDSMVQAGFRPPHPGLSASPAGLGEIGPNGAERDGGIGGAGLGSEEARLITQLSPLGGGGGAAGGPGTTINIGLFTVSDDSGSDGGGTFTVLAKEAITNNGTINANGASAGTSIFSSRGGGGGGGYVILASKESVTNSSTGTVTATGGNGEDADANEGPSGGGGGGLVHFIAPTTTNDGTVDVSGGSAGATTTDVTSTPRSGGGGGGGSIGSGGAGGDVPSGASVTADAGGDGNDGVFVETPADPAAMF